VRTESVKPVREQLISACPKSGPSLLFVFTGEVALFPQRNSMLGGGQADPARRNGRTISFAFSFQNSV
jgi:hypothetical protein